MQISNSCLVLAAGGWWEPLIVGAVLVAAAAWLTFRAVRFFRGGLDCSCGSRRKGCPASGVSEAIRRAMNEDRTRKP